MPVFPQDITVDLNVELTNNVLNSIHVNQYEHKSREIHIYVKKDGIDYPIPNDLTVNIRIHKSNGYDIYKTIGKDIGTINGNIITILVDESMTIASGRQICDIEFIDSNKNRLYSTKFYINVHKSALDDNNIKDNDDYSTVQSLARESKEYANLSKSYAVGTNNEIRENDSIDNAKYYKEQSEIAKNIAVSKAEEASVSESNAKESENNAVNSANIATTKANEASTSATNSENYAKQSQSYAVGAGNVRPNEASDNAKYYYEQAKSISESFSGTLRPKGTIGFSLFANTVMNTASEGDMYNISDEFVTSPIFKEGEGNVIPAGANIYKTADGMWDVLAGSPVTSVNGMRGNVSITKNNIGLGNVGNFKAVSTVASQGLSDSEKINARDNIGAMSSSIQSLSLQSIEMYPPSSNATWGGFIDFHYGKSTADYTSRIIEDAYGVLSINNIKIGNGKIVGTLDGNATTATKATQDGDGRVIKDTYALKSSVPIYKRYNVSSDKKLSTTLQNNIKDITSLTSSISPATIVFGQNWILVGAIDGYQDIFSFVAFEERSTGKMYSGYCDSDKMMGIYEHDGTFKNDV